MYSNELFGVGCQYDWICVNQSDMQSVGEVLKRGRRGINTQQLLTIYKLRKFWPEVVGEKIARASFVTRFRQEKLYVAVTNSAWLSELRLHQESIMQTLSEATGLRIRELHCTVATLPLTI